MDLLVQQTKNLITESSIPGNYKGPRGGMKCQVGGDLNGFFRGFVSLSKNL